MKNGFIIFDLKLTNDPQLEGDFEGVIMIDTLSVDHTITVEVYVQDLKQLKRWLMHVSLHKDLINILLQCHNTRPHTGTFKAIIELEWIVPSHPPYSIIWVSFLCPFKDVKEVILHQWGTYMWSPNVAEKEAKWMLPR